MNQREVGRNTRSFADALRASLREDPNVILVGEMRDHESRALAISAAETGQLVLGSLHTQSALATVDRILDAFPSDQQNQVRSQLSESLKGIVAQRLLKRADGRGRVAAIEILFGTPAVANLIREKKTFQLASVMQTSKKDGMLLFEDSVLGLVRQGIVSVEDAGGYGIDPDVLERAGKEGAGKAPAPTTNTNPSLPPAPVPPSNIDGILDALSGEKARPGSLAARVGDSR
jgi:twitching motility protein PilT